jgi:hypothetical protein
VSPVIVCVVAVELNVTAVPLVAPPFVNGVTTYPVITLPPFDAGAVHESVTWESPTVPVTLVGGPGTTLGVTGLDWTDSEPVPTALTASTVKVYVVPLVRPVTVWVVLVELNVTGVPLPALV